MNLLKLTNIELEIFSDVLDKLKEQSRHVEGIINNNVIQEVLARGNRALEAIRLRNTDQISETVYAYCISVYEQFTVYGQVVSHGSVSKRNMRIQLLNEMSRDYNCNIDAIEIRMFKKVLGE